MVTIEDYDVSECFQHSRSTESVKSTVSETYLSKPSIVKRRANQQETEQFYFMKLREYLEGSNLITKLQAKHDLLQRTLGEGQLFEIDGKVTWIIDCILYIFHEVCRLWICALRSREHCLFRFGFISFWNTQVLPGTIFLYELGTDLEEEP